MAETSKPRWKRHGLPLEIIDQPDNEARGLHRAT
jgi:hypothetical protein